MTPLELINILREVVAEECGCNASWEQHPEPLSRDEMAAIRSRVLYVLQTQPSQAVLRINSARLKSA